MLWSMIIPPGRHQKWSSVRRPNSKACKQRKIVPNNVRNDDLSQPCHCSISNITTTVIKKNNGLCISTAERRERVALQNQRGLDPLKPAQNRTRALSSVSCLTAHAKTHDGGYPRPVIQENAGRWQSKLQGRIGTTRIT